MRRPQFRYVSHVTGPVLSVDLFKRCFEEYTNVVASIECFQRQEKYSTSVYESFGWRTGGDINSAGETEPKMKSIILTCFSKQDNKLFHPTLIALVEAIDDD